MNIWESFSLQLVTIWLQTNYYLNKEKLRIRFWPKLNIESKKLAKSESDLRTERFVQTCRYVIRWM